MPKCTGAWRAGACTATTIDLYFGLQGDPSFYLPREILSTWCDLMVARPLQQAAVAKVWQKTVRHLQAGRRWARAKGPLGVVVASLLDLNWIPCGPLLWQDPNGQQWAVGTHLPEVRWQLADALEDSVRRKIWGQAARHFCGSGLEQGVDNSALLLHLRQLRKQGRFAQAACLETMAQGAYWPGERCVLAGYGEGSATYAPSARHQKTLST